MSSRIGVREVAGIVATFAVTAGVLWAAYAIAQTPEEITARDLPAAATPMDGGDDRVIYRVGEEASASQIGADLAELGVIRSGRQFEILVELMGVAGQLAAGEHLLRKGGSTLAAIEALTVRESGPVVRMTFPEGIRFEEMAEIVEESGLVSAEDFIAAVEAADPPPEIAETLPEGATLQGYLFPDTYILPEGSTADELVQLMLETFMVRFNATLRQAALANGLDLHRAVTLAAIVEREAVIAEERPLIAGVFLNRLEASDLLGADPTVQYAVAELDPLSVQQHGWWKRELTIEDLELDSPYNTRKFAGLPPGPITNPGLASLEAVANPEETDFYFFFADAIAGDGSHRFAITQEEHDRNQQEFGAP